MKHNAVSLGATKIESDPDSYYKAQYLRTDMCHFLPNQYSKVLEIGCGAGNFRQFLNAPCEYWGIEPSQYEADIAKTKLDKVFDDFYDNVVNELPNVFFDLVIANDVIEHMQQPCEFLQSIKTKMTENAFIILSVPNVRYYNNLNELLFKKDWRYRDSGVLDKTHLRFFTKKSFERLICENGFEIEEIKGMNSLCNKGLLSWIQKHVKIKYSACKIAFGSDIDFLQWGVRAKKKQSQ